ncbi:hypothetical protein [Paenibacillus albidus]|uniref:hypothetical protein n=1 Tax=Paenibacillus albidus TaxID=2041023 RepID=UPI001BE9B8E8|nr:hypothetical protein [Paenibacillus albidus]
MSNVPIRINNYLSGEIHILFAFFVNYSILEYLIFLIVCYVEFSLNIASAHSPFTAILKNNRFDHANKLLLVHILLLIGQAAGKGKKAACPSKKDQAAFCPKGISGQV